MFITSGLTSKNPLVVTAQEGHIYVDADGDISTIDPTCPTDSEVSLFDRNMLIIDCLNTLRLLPAFTRVEANIITNPHIFVLARDTRLAFPEHSHQTLAGIARSLHLIDDQPITTREQAGHVARLLEAECRGVNEPWWVGESRQAWRELQAIDKAYRLTEPMRMVHMYSIVSNARDMFDSAYYSHVSVRDAAVSSGMLHEATIVDKQGPIVTCVGARPLRVRVGKNVLDVTNGYTPQTHCPTGRVLATRVDSKGRFISRIKTKEASWRKGARVCLMEEPFGGARRLRNHNRWIDRFRMAA